MLPTVFLQERLNDFFQYEILSILKLNELMHN